MAHFLIGEGLACDTRSSADNMSIICHTADRQRDNVKWKKGGEQRMDTASIYPSSDLRAPTQARQSYLYAQKENQFKALK